MHALRFTLLFATLPILLIGSTLPAGPQKQAIVWRHDFSKAWAEAQQSGRPMVLHFYADWCGPCRQMERNVLNSRDILKQLGTGFVAVKVNSDNYPNLVQKFNIRALPSDVFIDPDGRVISQSEGYTDRGRYLAKLSRIDARFAQSRKNQIAKDEARKETKLPRTDKDSAAEENGTAILKVAENAVGLDGYSPVALTKSRKWTTGKKEFEFTYQSVVYRMATAKELQEFKDHPRQFSPRLLGCDPVVLWKTDRAVVGSTEYGAFFDGELYLFSTRGSRELFKQNPIRYTQTRHVLKLEQIVKGAQLR